MSTILSMPPRLPHREARKSDYILRWQSLWDSRRAVLDLQLNALTAEEELLSELLDQ